MDMKFIYTIGILTFIFAHILFYQKSNRIIFKDEIFGHLWSNVDTCYYSKDKIVISVKLKNGNSSRLKISDNINITTQNILKNGIIKINILHNGELYEHAYLEGKEEMPNRKIFKSKSIVVKHLIHFRQLIQKKEISSMPVGNIKIDNKNFGLYELQALYITDSNDTIFSNKIQVSYLGG